MSPPQATQESDARSARADACPARVVAIANPKAGSAAVEAIHRALGGCFSGGESHLEIYELKPDDKLGDVVRDRVAKGADLVIAAGGDGTVSAVADALAGSGRSMGILPMGTANVLARELGIPVDVEQAARLLGGENGRVAIDAMKVDGKHYLTQAGVGLDALMIRDTPTERKKRFGNLAYLWTASKHLVGFQPRRFELEVDGQRTTVRASEVVVANVGTLGQPPFRWGPGIRPDDGAIDVCISRAKGFLDYVSLAWHVATGRHRADSNVRYLKARRSVSIATRHPLPVQADGEIIGETPVLVELAPGAVTVVVPAKG